jgi:uncharacterized repeat protein (TIGR03803 family)
MHSAKANAGTRSCLNISDVNPGFEVTKQSAGAPHIRVFCECVGVCAIRGALTLAVLTALLLITARPAHAQGEAALYNFCAQPNCTDGNGPQSRLTSDGAGNFYGTTASGGAFGYGTVFEVSANGSGGWNESVLYSFCSEGAPNCTDGAYPAYSYVIFDSARNLYGTAAMGGANGCGVVFELSPTGTSWMETVLFSFGLSGSGCAPVNGLIMDRAGNLYGVTNSFGDGTETVFELSQVAGVWTQQMIYDLGIAAPNSAGLTMDAAGNIFGTSLSTVFELSPNGSGGWNPTVIHTFTGAPKDGSDVQGTPALDQYGNLYGTTDEGGERNYGTVYRLTPGQNGKWTEKVLYSFYGPPYHYNPWAGVVLDAAGNIYGTTLDGGEGGSVFELLVPVGKAKYKEKALWAFDGEDGNEPYGSLILDSLGNLYGTTAGVYPTVFHGNVFGVNPSAAVTSTTFTSSPNPSSKGQEVTYTATVTSSAGPPPDGETVTFLCCQDLQFKVGTGTLNAGVASVASSIVGNNFVIAVYAGDMNFTASKSEKRRQVVKPK